MNIADYFAVLHRQPTKLSDRLTAAIADLQNRTGMRIVHQSSTLLVVAPENVPKLVLTADHGIILGMLFDKFTFKRQETPQDTMNEPAEIVSCNYWGGYVALRSHHHTPEVFRDPSGAIPCYVTSIDDVQIVTSTPHLLFDLNLLNVELDWTILRQALVYRDIKPARTILRGIAELLPAMSARLYPTGLDVRCVWSPWTFATNRSLDDLDAATDRVKDVVTRCVTAWSSSYERPLLEISGGLDSAIVSSIAAKAGPCTAFTLAPALGDPDETPYAEAIAAHIGVDLAKLTTEIGSLTTAFAARSGEPRPYTRSYLVDLNESARAHAHRCGIDAFMTGGGGDNIFCYTQSLAPVIDRIVARGGPTRVFSTAADLAALTNSTIWKVVSRLLRRAFVGPGMPWFHDARLLDAEAIADLPFPADHPWTTIPTRARWGQILHVRMLISIQNHLEGLGRAAAAPVISPLLSQPIMETCLSIPSWLWCAGGNNRAVARRAFAADLPESVTARRTKGGFDSRVEQYLHMNRDTVRDLLLGGLLAKQGLLDLRGVEAAMDAGKPEITMRLWHLVDVELWARSWTAS